MMTCVAFSAERKDHHLAQAIWPANVEQLDSDDIAKDCLLTCQNQACLLLVHLVGRSFVRLSPCQNYLVYFYRQKYGYWIRPSDQGHRQKSFSRPDQERGIIGPASLVHSRYWVFFNRLSLRQFKLKIQPSLKELSMIWVKCRFTFPKYRQSAH